MIIYVDSTENHQVTVQDESLLIPEAGNLPLVHIWTLPAFIRAFPTFPFRTEIERASYEPENDLYHIGVGGNVTAYRSPADHFYFIWMMLNEDAITSASICEVKPILRPLSSIAKEEAYKFGVLLTSEADMEDKEVGIGKMVLMGATYPTIVYKDKEDEEYSITIQFSSIGISGIDLIPYDAYEWLFKHHFDVFGLIGKGLAIAK